VESYGSYISDITVNYGLLSMLCYLFLLLVRFNIESPFKNPGYTPAVSKSYTQLLISVHYMGSIVLSATNYFAVYHHCMDVLYVLLHI